MPEQGPTEEVARNDLAYRIATDVLGDPSRADGLAEWLATGDSTDLGVAVRRLVESARARHVREAVEGVTDRDLWSVLNSAGFGEGDIRVFRAALLAALGGTP